MQDTEDLYIRYQDHPNFIEDVITVISPVDIAVQKIEVLLFTNKGDVLGFPDMGCNMEDMLWKTNLSSSLIRETIISQISTYVPEIPPTAFNVEVEIVPGTVQDICLVSITVYGKSIQAVFA